MKYKVPFNLSVEENRTELVSVGTLLDEFHEWCRGTNPSPLILNPEIRGQTIWPRQDVWIGIFSKGYYVKVERNQRNSFGPHTAKVFYSDTNNRGSWLATAQIETPFLNKEEMHRAIKRAITRCRFFASELSRKEMVEIPREIIGEI